MASGTVAHLLMSGPLFYISLGIGLALAAGLRPFLPALLAGGLASGGDLGVSFSGHYDFLQSSWWLILLTAALVGSYLLQLRLGSERFSQGPFAAALAGIEIGVAALLFGGTLAAHGDPAWPGWIAGGLLGAVANAAVGPVITRARDRLPDRAAREALTVYLDGVALTLAALTAVLHPVGYLALALLLWLLGASRRRAGEKYAGLRILRR